MNIHKVTFALLVIGGLNALLEAFSYGLAYWLPDLAMLFYILFGVSAIYEIVSHRDNCRHCEIDKPTTA